MSFIQRRSGSQQWLKGCVAYVRTLIKERRGNEHSAKVFVTRHEVFVISIKVSVICLSRLNKYLKELVKSLCGLIKTLCGLNHVKVDNIRSQNKELLNLNHLSPVYQLFRRYFKLMVVAFNQGVGMLKARRIRADYINISLKKS